MVNVNIIEGDYSVNECYEDFKRDYMACELSMKEIDAKYGLSTGQSYRLRKQVVDETGFKRGVRGRPMKEAKHYTYDKSLGKWRVGKRVNGEMVYYGYYPSENTAKMIVAELKKVNWDKNSLDEIKQKVMRDG